MAFRLFFGSKSIKQPIAKINRNSYKPVTAEAAEQSARGMHRVNCIVWSLMSRRRRDKLQQEIILRAVPYYRYVYRPVRFKVTEASAGCAGVSSSNGPPLQIALYHDHSGP